MNRQQSRGDERTTPQSATTEHADRGDRRPNGNLPSWTEHLAHSKLTALTVPTAPEPFTVKFLNDARTQFGSETKARILDVGCGRGDTVAWLCENGWDACGVDVDDRYLANGRQYLD